MLHDIAHDKPAGSSPEARASGDQVARQQAVRQIERKRRFRIRFTMGTLGMIILVIIWAFSEYHNAGGWPTQGFSQSSGIHDVWNFWIIYPAIAWVLLTAGDAWWTFGRKPISESEIQREVDREASLRH
jgi:2TM domain